MKKILAYSSAFIVFLFGTICYINYFTLKDSNLLQKALFLIGGMIIFGPAYSYWQNKFKKIFNTDK